MDLESGYHLVKKKPLARKGERTVFVAILTVKTTWFLILSDSRFFNGDDYIWEEDAIPSIKTNCEFTISN